MEARIYFRLKSVQARVEKANLLRNHLESYLDKSAEFIVDKLSNLVYIKVYEYHELDIPVLCKGLKIVKIVIFDTLNKEENNHIPQGQGKEGKTKWTVYFDSEEFEIPNNNPYNSTYAYKSLIKIRIYGTNVQSVKSCYNKIRKGDIDNCWKGASYAPSHCGLPETHNQM